VPIPADQKILHVLPQEFIIDGQEGIREPIGMSGVRLEAKVHLVTGAVSAAQNVPTPTNPAHSQHLSLKVRQMVFARVGPPARRPIFQ
jgi:cell division ATPase FtsA